MIYFIILFALARLADSAVTQYAINHGFKELNPLMKWIVSDPGRAWSFCIASILAVTAMVSFLPYTVGMIIIVPGAIVQTLVVVRGIFKVLK